MKYQSAAVNSAVKNTPPRPRDRAARAKKHGIKGRQTTKRKREESHCKRLFPAAHPKQNLRATIPSDRTPSHFGTERRFGASTYGSYRSAWRIGHYADKYLRSRYPKRRATGSIGYPTNADIRQSRSSTAGSPSGNVAILQRIRHPRAYGAMERRRTPPGRIITRLFNRSAIS